MLYTNPSVKEHDRRRINARFRPLYPALPFTLPFFKRLRHKRTRLTDAINTPSRHPRDARFRTAPIYRWAFERLSSVSPVYPGKAFQTSFSAFPRKGLHTAPGLGIISFYGRQVPLFAEACTPEHLSESIFSPDYIVRLRVR